MDEMGLTAVPQPRPPPRRRRLTQTEREQRDRERAEEKARRAAARQEAREQKAREKAEKAAARQAAKEQKEQDKIRRALERQEQKTANAAKARERARLRYQIQKLVAGKTAQLNLPVAKLNMIDVLTILQKFPSARFLIHVGGVYFTISPENIQNLLHRFRQLRTKEVVTGTEVDKYGNVYEITAQEEDDDATWDLNLTIAATGKGKRSAGGFFKYINLTCFDLTRYGIYQEEADIETDENCLFVALCHGGFPEEQRGNLRYLLKTRDIPEYKLKEVCAHFGIKIRLSKAGRTIIYGETGETYNIGLLDDHYFINDTCNVTTYAVDNYQDIKDLPDPHRIYSKEGNKYKRRDKFPPSFRIIQKLLESKFIRPIKYCDEIMKTPFHAKFKKRKGIVLDSISESNFEKPKEKKPRKEMTALRYFFDFETDTTCKNDDGSNANHRSYGVSVYHSETEHKWFEGNRHVYDALDWICRSAKKHADGFLGTEYKIILLAHNLTYDLRFLMDHVMLKSILQKGSRTLTAQAWYQHNGDKVDFQLKDTACMIQMKLSQFGSCFQLPTEKEVMPYKLYTETNIQRRFCTIAEAHRVFDEADQGEDKEQFSQNLDKLGLRREDDTFDIMEYAKYYCLKDTEVLAKGYHIFREWMFEALDIDIDNQVTISSVSRTYLQKRGCFEGVENLGGITREFHQQFVVGGRVMTRENKKVHAKRNISDYDAVSLYPSAMARMPGFLKGKPKLLQPEQLNKEFLDTTDGYFIHARITHVGKRRVFPLMSEFAENGTRSFDNDVQEIYVDKTAFEDLIEFQDISYEILDGCYYDEGRNPKIGEVMRELFELRKQKKREGNPIETVYKLIMNSGYGFTLMKAPEHDLQVKCRDEAETYIGRNYAHIHSIVEIGANKLAVKTHKCIDDHYVPVHAGVEVLSWSKRIMNEAMCLAEDNDIPIFYQDTDSMHLPEEDVPKLEELFEAKYGRTLRGKDLGQFHPDFEFMDMKGGKLKGFDNIRSTEGIFVGKKAYLDILEAERDGKTYQNLHIRCKGTPTCTLEWTAHSGKTWDAPGRVEAVRDLYMKLLNSESVEFDLTQDGRKVVFDTQRNFTVRTRDKFTRNVSFKNSEILHF